jgi:molybdate transport system permease protein
MNLVSRIGVRLLSALLVALLVAPLLAMLWSTSVDEILLAWRAPTMRQALLVSLKTTLVSLGLVLAGGTPLAWWLSRKPKTVLAMLATFVVRLPVLLPPAVLGFALLLAFGGQGVFGFLSAWFGVQVSFSVAAVVMAQTVVAVPFFVQAAQLGFASIDDHTLLVARTLGATAPRVLTRVLLPLAMPALVSGGAMAWARALGEFGATLFFAGSLPGRTQTLPLAIYAALESDVGLARALALLLVGLALGGLALGRVVLWFLQRGWR